MCECACVSVFVCVYVHVVPPGLHIIKIKIMCYTYRKNYELKISKYLVKLHTNSIQNIRPIFLQN